MQSMLPYRLPRFDKKTKRLLDPHVAVLGAGASVASCPVDKNGKKVPLLREIHNEIDFEIDFLQYGFNKDQLEDFEALYSDMFNRPECKNEIAHIEETLYDFFSQLQLPEHPTLYDYIILSLTQKDLIISFNWDPYLLQAYKRNINVGNLPQLSFPHGNVGVGLCHQCKKKGYYGYACPTCNNKFERMPLLFPIKNKDYALGIIKNEWEIAREYLGYAAGLTIFGYRAPETDAEALELMKNAFIKSNISTIAPVTIINLEREKDKQMQTWKDIYDERMFMFYSSFSETMLWRNPRVSLEHLFDAILQQHPREEKGGFHEFTSLRELQDFALNITGFEMKI